ncbi:MAG: hypothetical protein OXR66_03300 [Candidatus Woesearchaeota archaeon]|nr:hypothetical protein [Candidatus Woesearchaeota archaeon]
MYNLLQIGLTEGEAKVYLALSELGTSTVGPIVKKAHVAYSNIYDILQRLIDKGIVSFIVKSKTKHFQAVSPANLLEYLEKKETEIQEQKTALHNALPQLEQLQQLTPQQEAEIFLGERGFKTAYSKLFQHGMKYENNFFYIHKKRYAEKSDRVYFNILDLHKGTPQRGVVNKFAEKAEYFKHVPEVPARYVDIPLPGNLDVCYDRVLFICWEEPFTCVLIHSMDLANNFRTYFDAMWELGKPLNP